MHLQAFYLLIIVTGSELSEKHRIDISQNPSFHRVKDKVIKYYLHFCMNVFSLSFDSILEYMTLGQEYYDLERKEILSSL